MRIPREEEDACDGAPSPSDNLNHHLADEKQPKRGQSIRPQHVGVRVVPAVHTHFVLVCHQLCPHKTPKIMENQVLSLWFAWTRSRKEKKNAYNQNKRQLWYFCLQCRIILYDFFKDIV